MKKIFAAVLCLLTVLTQLAVPVAASEVSVESIDVYQVHSLKEGYYGKWCTELGDNGEESVYWRYSPKEAVSGISITYTDGSTEEFSSLDELEGWTVECEQSFAEQWAGGNTYEAVLTYGGASDTFSVEIADDGVLNYVVEDVTLFTGIHGEYVTELDEEGLAHTYFKYSIYEDDWDYSPFKGVKLEYENFYKNSYESMSRHPEFQLIDDQSWDNQWVPGNTYPMQIRCFGRILDFNVTVRDAVYYDYEVRDGGAYITGWGDDTSQMKVLDAIIPSEIGGYPVVGIDCLTGRAHRVYSVVVPDSVTTIKTGVFEKMDSTDSVVLGSGVSGISPKTFEGMDSLQSIEVSVGNPNYTSYDGVLYDKDITKLIVYPVGKGNTYDLPKTVTNLVNTLYYEGIVFTNSAEEPDFTVTEGVTLSEDGKTILSCDKDIKGYYVMPDTVERVAEGAFKDCDGLIGITFSNSVTDIAYATFDGCTALFEVVLPESLKTIGAYAFSSCRNLKKIELSNGLTDIGENAFMYSGIEYILIPDSVVSIGEGCFAGTKLKVAVVGESVAEIPDEAFIYCAELEMAVLGSNIERIGESVFAGCVSLRYINIPDKTTEVGSGTFYECSLLTEPPIGKNQTVLSSSVFYGCAGFVDVVIPDNIVEIQTTAFDACVGMKTVYIPDSVKVFGSSIFIHCVSLEYLPIGKNQTESGVFLGCDSLVNVVIPDNITSINNYAFSTCPGLESIAIPRSVKYIGTAAFTGTKLSKIYYGGTEAEWNEIEFGENLAEIISACDIICYGETGKTVMIINGEAIEYDIGEKVEIKAEKVSYDTDSKKYFAFEEWYVNGLALEDNTENEISFTVEGFLYLKQRSFVLGNADSSADGSVDSLDLLGVCAAIKESKFIKYADTDFDEALTSIDLLNICSIIKGTYTY